MKKNAVILPLIFFSISSFAQDNTFISLAFVNHLKKGSYSAAYSYFDQTITNKVTVQALESAWTNTKVKLGEFIGTKGTASEWKDSIETVIVKGQFDSGDLDIKFVYNTQHKIVGFFFVPPKEMLTPYSDPSYDNKSVYKEQQISIKTRDNLKLPAACVVPKQKKKYPVVIFVHGSGPSDKDETVGSLKIFRDMAVGLAQYGIASVRFDKRTKVYPEQFVSNNQYTVNDEVTHDALAAIYFAKKLEGVDTNAIYIIGHSLGGMMAPRINELYPKLKGIVLMAANARSFQDLLLEQVIYIASLDGLTDKENIQINQFKEELEVTKDSLKIAAKPAKDLPLGLSAAYWIDLDNYKQVEEAKSLQDKILILQGERDYQVTMEDFKLWKEALGKKENVTFKSYPSLNHMFIEGTGKSIPAEYKKRGNVPEYVIMDIAGFINK